MVKLVVVKFETKDELKLTSFLKDIEGVLSTDETSIVGAEIIQLRAKKKSDEK